MSRHRTTSSRMGRPLIGNERLDATICVKVSRSMDAALRARGDVPAFVRRAIERALAAGGRAGAARKKTARRGKTKHRV